MNKFDKIGISLLGIHPKLGGNYVYAINLIEDLKNFKKKLKLILFIDNKNLINPIKKLFPKSKIVYIPHQKFTLFFKIILFFQELINLNLMPSIFIKNYKILDNYGCKAIFFPYWHIACYFTKTKSIASIHDCAPVEKGNPAKMSWLERFKLHFLIKLILQKSQFILVDSIYGKKLLKKYYKVKANILIKSFRPLSNFTNISKNINSQQQTEYKSLAVVLLLIVRFRVIILSHP